MILTKDNYIQKITSFLKTNPQGILAIVGPTSGGKTAISLDIAEKIGGEIINADSKQVYQGLTVTTGHISEKEMRGIPHHLFGYVSPETVFTVKEHCDDAVLKIKQILQRKKAPILVGGTGLFINALTLNLKIPASSVNKDLSKKLAQKTTAELWQELLKVDSDYANKTHPNNRLRVIRALEVFYVSGQKKSQAGQGNELFPSMIMMPQINDRSVLYEKINNRTEFIWQHGLLEEAQVFFAAGTNENLPAMKSIGIPEAFAFFKKELTAAEALEKMKKKSRNYAKRQLTWWRNDERVIKINIEEFDKLMV